MVDLDALQKMIDSVPWRETDFGGAHHAYIIIHKVPEVWRELAKAIDEQGVIEQFYGHPFKYLYLNGYRYWHYEVVLNRAKIEDIPEDSRK